jgi:hypothetical protein
MMLFALELPFFHCGIYSYSKFEALITRIGVVVTNQVLSRSGTNSRCGKICLNTLISTRSAWLRPVKLFSPKKTNLEQHACESAHKHWVFLSHVDSEVAALIVQAEAILSLLLSLDDPGLRWVRIAAMLPRRHRENRNLSRGCRS